MNLKELMQKFSLNQYNSPSALINVFWKRLNKVPGGKVVFSKLAGQMIPYTGSVSPLVQTIEPGFASVLMRDKKFVRNHLNSLHAIALANVGEFTTGLCLFSIMEENAKAILVKIEIEYLKKARGDVVAEASFEPPKNISGDTNFIITANITNFHKEIVCKVMATWRVRP